MIDQRPIWGSRAAWVFKKSESDRLPRWDQVTIVPCHVPSLVYGSMRRKEGFFGECFKFPAERLVLKRRLIFMLEKLQKSKVLGDRFLGRFHAKNVENQMVAFFIGMEPQIFRCLLLPSLSWVRHDFPSPRGDGSSRWRVPCGRMPCVCDQPPHCGFSFTCGADSF